MDPASEGNGAVGRAPVRERRRTVVAASGVGKP